MGRRELTIAGRVRLRRERRVQLRGVVNRPDESAYG